jgi:hypothetical protein
MGEDCRGTVMVQSHRNMSMALTPDDNSDRTENGPADASQPVATGAVGSKPQSGRAVAVAFHR